MPIRTGFMDTSSGLIIFSTEPWNSSRPTIIIMKEIISEEIYSMRPWPKGCSLSGLRPDSRAPITATNEEPISEMLLKASEVMAMLPVIMPMGSFTANSSRLQITPNVPASTP